MSLNEQVTEMIRVDSNKGTSTLTSWMQTEVPKLVQAHAGAARAEVIKAVGDHLCKMTAQQFQDECLNPETGLLATITRGIQDNQNKHQEHTSTADQASDEGPSGDDTMADQSGQDSDGDSHSVCQDSNTPAEELTHLTQATATQGRAQDQPSEPAWHKANEQILQVEHAPTSEKRPRESSPTSGEDLFAPKRVEAAPKRQARRAPRAHLSRNQNHGQGPARQCPMEQ